MDNIKWKRAKAGCRFQEDVLYIPDGSKDARLGRCAIWDCIYIPIVDLMKLPIDNEC